MYGPFSYIGGKRALAGKIIALFPEHRTYVEPFAGGAQVFFRKQPSKVEVLNDLDREIVNFYRVCQQHYEELVRYLRFTVVSRAWFELLDETDPEKLTDIQRAARHLYLAKTCYAGLVRHRNYSIRVDEPPGFNPERIPALIEETHQRLARVQLECLPYEEILKRYDRPGTLFYLDPPYFKIRLYRYNLEPDDYHRMAERLGKIKGKFILSLNNVPEVRAIFKAFHIQDIELAYTAQKIAGRRFREVLIILHVSHSKTPEGESRVVPLTGRLYDLLKSFRKERGIVFTYAPPQKPPEANASEDSKASAGNPIKIVKTAWAGSLRRAHLRHFRFHDLRHTANTRLMLAGVLQEIRREIIGHSSQHSRDTNDRYSQIGLAELKDAIAKLELWLAAQANQLAKEEAQSLPEPAIPSTTKEPHYERPTEQSQPA